MEKKIMILCLALVFFGCTNRRQDEIVKDKDGKYYRLNGKDALGSERYQLELIDTTAFKKF